MRSWLSSASSSSRDCRPFASLGGGLPLGSTMAFRLPFWPGLSASIPPSRYKRSHPAKHHGLRILKIAAVSLNDSLSFHMRRRTFNLKAAEYLLYFLARPSDPWILYNFVQ